MKIILKIQRFNPDTDEAPYLQEYEVEANPNERLLDALMQVKRFQDGSLGFRKSCAHGVCGSTARMAWPARPSSRMSPHRTGTRSSWNLCDSCPCNGT